MSTGKRHPTASSSSGSAPSAIAPEEVAERPAKAARTTMSMDVQSLLAEVEGAYEATDQLHRLLAGSCENDLEEIAELLFDVRMECRVPEVYSITGPHVVEIYSPPRLTAMAPTMGLIPGYALDLTVPKPDKPDEFWDLSDNRTFQEAQALQDTERPRLLTGCPPCEAFGTPDKA